MPHRVFVWTLFGCTATLRFDLTTLYRSSLKLRAFLATALVAQMLAVPLWAQECVYVTNRRSGTVAVINASTNTVETTILLPAIEWCDNEQPPINGIEPAGIAVSPDGQRLYVTSGQCVLYVIDAASRKVVRSVPVVGEFERPGEVAVSPDGGSVYITDNRYDNDARQGGVSALDATTYNTRKHMGLATGVSQIAVSRDGSRLYLGTQPLKVVDTQSWELVRSIETGGFPSMLALAPDGGVLYAAMSLVPPRDQQRGVFAFDTLTGGLAGSVPLASTPTWLAIAPDGRHLYAPEPRSGQITVIGTEPLEFTGSIPVEPLVKSLALTHDGRTAYAATDAEAIAVIDTETRAVRATVPLTECGRVTCGGRFLCNPYEPCEPERIAVGPCLATVTPTPTRTRAGTPTSTPTPLPCPGDCDHDLAVYIEELVRAVNIALGLAPVGECGCIDTNDDQLVTVDELVRAVDMALKGCR